MAKHQKTEEWHTCDICCEECEPVGTMPTWKLYEGDCLEVMREMPSESVDAVVTDPPYGLSREPDIEEVLRHWLAGDDYKHRGGGFMGKTWDSFVPGPSVWREVYRVLKPGGHILCFAGTRTVDLMSISLRLGGFEIRDCLQWLYGSGFPKSLDVSKAIDKKLGADTLEGAKWQGWGTALKPAHEPIIVARKPLIGTVAENVEKYGTGALNIDGCRIPTEDNLNGGAYAKQGTPRNDGWGMQRGGAGEYVQPKGRFPANVILDEEAARLLDEQSGILKSGGGNKANKKPPARKSQVIPTKDIGEIWEQNSGGASRFFYCAKASRSERTMGGKVENNHPTVKPIKLMRYLCRLITPPSGTVLDPFTGSGTTLLAAVQEGFSAIGIEREPEYCDMIRKRMAELQPALPLAK